MSRLASSRHARGDGGGSRQRSGATSPAHLRGDKIGAMRDLASGQNRINTNRRGGDGGTSSRTLRQVAEGDSMARAEATIRAASPAGVGHQRHGPAPRRDRRHHPALGPRPQPGGGRDQRRRRRPSPGAPRREASSLEETAATTEELAASVKQTPTVQGGERALRQGPQARLRRMAASCARRSRRWSASRRPSRKITDIIAVIERHRLLTNLLALNAAVEAARARRGGQGLRRRRLGGAHARPALRPGGARHQGPDHRLGRAGRSRG